jgi:hypothetical protein
MLNGLLRENRISQQLVIRSRYHKARGDNMKTSITDSSSRSCTKEWKNIDRVLFKIFAKRKDFERSQRYARLNVIEMRLNHLVASNVRYKQ